MRNGPTRALLPCRWLRHAKAELSSVVPPPSLCLVVRSPRLISAASAHVASLVVLLSPALLLITECDGKSFLSSSQIHPPKFISIKSTIAMESLGTELALGTGSASRRSMVR
jgi:hypothetical protein